MQHRKYKRDGIVTSRDLNMDAEDIHAYPKFAANFLVVTSLKTLAVYPYQLTGEKSISNHGYQITIKTIFCCNLLKNQ